MNPDDPFVMSERLYWMKSGHDAQYRDNMRSLLSAACTGIWAIFGVLVVISGVLIVGLFR